MHRTDGPGHIDNQFTEGNPATGTPATIVTAEWLNAVQEEVAGVIEAAGIELDKEDNAQLLAAITQIAAEAAPPAAPNYVTGLLWEQASATEVTIHPGEIGMDGTTYTLDAAVTLTITTSAATLHWEYLRVEAPAEGTALSAANFSHSPNAPTHDAAAGLFSEGAHRVFGCVLMTDANEIDPFTVEGGQYWLHLALQILYEGNATTLTAVSAGTPALGRLIIHMTCYASDGTYSTPYVYIFPGDATNGTPRVYCGDIIARGDFNSTAGTGVGTRGSTITNVSGQVKYLTKSGGGATLGLLGFQLPRGFAGR